MIRVWSWVAKHGITAAIVAIMFSSGARWAKLSKLILKNSKPLGRPTAFARPLFFAKLKISSEHASAKLKGAQLNIRDKYLGSP
jgi:hypothetical protein